MRRGRLNIALIVVIGVLLLVTSGCSGGGQAAPTPTVSGSVPAPENGLCSYIDASAAAVLLTGTGGASVVSTPVEPAAGQLARCDFSGEVTPRDVVKISLTSNDQNGVDTFAQLKANPALHSQNMNGVPMVWDATQETLYIRFTNTNPAFTHNPRGEASILTITYTPFSCTPNPQDPPSPQVLDDLREHLTTFAQNLGGDINSSKVVNPPSPIPGLMLLDDRGRQVPNPIVVMGVYSALQSDPNDLIMGYLRECDIWPKTREPYIWNADARSKILASMAVHPNCDNGCTYPGFAVTGWNSSTAKQDALQLGINPDDVPDPKVGAGLPVYTSNFPACMCYWTGSYLPSG